MQTEAMPQAYSDRTKRTDSSVPFQVQAGDVLNALFERMPLPDSMSSGQILPVADVTQILERAQSGDPSAASELLPLVYDELRKLAAHRLAGEGPTTGMPR